MVDGSSRLGAFFRILLPLVAPGLVATSVFVFITSWNEFIFAYVLLNDQSKQTITVWLSRVLRDEPPGRLGRADGGFDPRRDPGSDLLRVRAAEDRVRADRGGGERPDGRDRPRPDDQGVRQRLHGDRRRLADDRRRRVHGARRPVGLRQVDAAADDRRARGGDRRDDLDRRPRRHRARAAPPRHRDGLPELRAVPAHGRAPEPRLRAEGAEDPDGRGRPARDGGGAAPRPGEAPRPQARGALRRPAAARGDGPRDRPRAGRVPDGRAALEPRREAPRRRCAPSSRACTTGSA